MGGPRFSLTANQKKVQKTTYKIPEEILKGANAGAINTNFNLVIISTKKTRINCKHEEEA